MTKNLWITLCAILVLTGCEKGPVEADNATTGSGSATSASASTPQDKPKPSLQDLPASIKHDAFAYYGLGNTKTMDLRLTGDNLDQSGGISVELEKVEDGRAHFKVLRTGAIGESLGTDYVMVDSAGIHATGNSMGKLTPENYLALPADLTPGKTWRVKNKIVRDSGQEVEEDSVYKVEGIRDFKTKSGVQKALLVTSSGNASVTTGGDTKKMKNTTKSWYVKGVGLAKSEISFIMPGQPSNTIVVELVD